MKPSVYVGAAALAEVLIAQLRKLVPGNHCEPLRVLLPFSVGAGIYPGGSDTKRGHWTAVGGIAHLRVCSQIAYNHHPVQSNHIATAFLVCPGPWEF